MSTVLPGPWPRYLPEDACVKSDLPPETGHLVPAASVRTTMSEPRLPSCRAPGRLTRVVVLVIVCLEERFSDDSSYGCSIARADRPLFRIAGIGKAILRVEMQAAASDPHGQSRLRVPYEEARGRRTHTEPAIAMPWTTHRKSAPPSRSNVSSLYVRERRSLKRVVDGIVRK